jgi:hypothetical protein
MNQKLHFNFNIIIVLLLLPMMGALAQSVAPVAGWDVNAQTGYGTSPLEATFTTANVTTTGLTRGSGVTTSGTAAARGWGGNGWNSATPEAAITSDAAVTFTVKANPGNTLSLASISQFDYRRSGSGPASGLLQYRINEGTYTDIATISFSSTSSSGASAGPISLSSITDLQAIPATSTVTFRIVPYGATSTAGTWYIFDKANSTESDLAIEGTVLPVSTPVAALSVSPSSLSGFATTLGTPSASQSYSLSAANLTADITITAPTGVEVSTDDATFVSSFTLAPTTSSATLYARLTGASEGTITGTITHTSDDLSAPVDVEGTVSALPTQTGSGIVISQVYGGGGNSGAPFQNDFIELHNRSSQTINLSGWSVQYASASGTSWQVTPLSGTIAPGGYFLVQEAAGSGTSAPLPTPDATGTIAMSGTNGKIALVNSSSALSGTCPTGAPLVDLVGYGSANCFEGSGATPGLSNTTAAIRKTNGTTDTDNNNADFEIGAPNPRNGALPAGPTIAATPATLTGTDALYYVHGNGPASTTISVSGTSFSSATGTISVTSSNPVFSVSPTSLAFIGSSLSPSTVTVELAAGLAVGTYSGTITLSGGGATLEVPVDGVVNSDSPFTPISIARAAVGQTFTIAGRVTVTNQLGSRQIYIQDATGGIVVYSGPAGPDFSTLVALGDSVQVSGPITVFNGFTEITGTGNFTVITDVPNRIPAPIVISLDQLPSYQGQLVQVTDATLNPVGTTFTGNSNYTITAAGQSGIMRINANSQLSGAGQPANPVSVTGIADRFVSGATTPGTNGLQLQPRILADIPGATAAQDQICVVPGPISSLTLDQTLDISTWNMEFFGADAGTIYCPNGNLNYNDMGPVNEDLQQTNAVSVLNKLNADIIAVEEISDINRFAATVAAIPGNYSYVCSDKFSYYFQDECTQSPSGNPPTVFGPTALAQKVCVIYNTATVTPVLSETKALLTENYTYPNANGWSSGRLPFMFVADATIAGITSRVHVVAIHAKSGSATADYNRRKQDIIDLKATLDSQYPEANIIILGDYNDKLNGSIAAGQQSSYQSLVTDATNYTPVTLALENQGCSTFNSSASFIDHMIISNDLAPAYVDNSAYVLQPFSIPNYGNTTSDHNPIVARFDLSKLTVPITSLTATATPATICSNATTQLSATLSGGNAPFTYTWTGPGTITNPGSATTEVSGLMAGEQIFTVTVTDVYNQMASTTVTVNVAAQPEVPAIASTSAVQGASDVVLTAANCPGALVWSGASSGSGSSIVVPTTTPGTYEYSVQCQVGTCLSENGSVSVTIIPLLTAAVTASPEAILTNQSSTLTATVTGGTAPYTYVWSGPGTITNANSATATVSDLSPGVQTFTVLITDATQPTSQTISKMVSVSVTQANRAPVASTLANQTVTAGNTFSLTIATAFSDPDNDVLTYAASGLPAGLSLTNGIINGMPTTPGVYAVAITASDPAGLSATIPFTITVLQGPLKILAPTYNCATRVLTINTIAGNGNAIEYQIPSVTKGWESQTTFALEAKHIGKDLKVRARQRASDGKGFTEVEISFTPTACAFDNIRLGVPEAETLPELTVTVLGNPVADEVRFEVRGAEGESLQLRLMNLQGQLIEARQIPVSGAVESHTFDVQRQGTGILLLQVLTLTEQKVVKVLKE